jgi:hypothetical protein
VLKIVSFYFNELKVKADLENFRRKRKGLCEWEQKLEMGTSCCKRKRNLVDFY